MEQSGDEIALADFLEDLRAELGEAQGRASKHPLKLGVEEITLALDVAYKLKKTGEASAKAKVSFFVWLSGEAGAKGSLSSENSRTHRLTLKLKPRIEQILFDEHGKRTPIPRGVDVGGDLAKDEERPSLPGVRAKKRRRGGA
jgi:hypothetical protein